LKNIKFRSNEIRNYFSKNRIRFNDFYPSEKKILVKHIKNNKSILDIGCGCGGLGLALNEKFKKIHYEGIEINALAASHGTKNFSNNNFFIYKSDFLELNLNKLKFKKYDYIFSFSCFDWQLNLNKSLKKVVNLLNKKSKFIISLRLTKKSSLTNFKNSYQFINYSNIKSGEKAPYIVLNALEFIDIINKLKLHIADMYGYYGIPSKTAVTDYKNVYFCVIVLKLGSKSFLSNLKMLPDNFYNHKL